MPPKSKKRKATTSTTAGSNAPDALTPPDRATWPGWVEMESEPAFFNVMLKEIGVRGVKIQEVYGLDDEMLAILPQPVHALIFLFRYRETEQDKLEKTCPKEVWFANQVPDFACATVAMLNIVNNIPGLSIGKELRDFRDFTQDMGPLSRGDAIDSFDFVRLIHNSFATENDLLMADMHLKEKSAKARKRQAVAKGAATKAAKAAEAAKARASTPLKEKSANVASTRARSSGRLKRAASGSSGAQSKASTPTKAANIGKKRSPAVKAAEDQGDWDDDFETPSKPRPTTEQKPNNLRRSERKPKPKVSLKAAAADDTAEEGFHFCAYMPINGHVWKLDGMDRFPQDMGTFDTERGGDWMNIAQPTLQGRMAQYEAGEIEFNLMAVVHDPLEKDRTALLENVKSLQAIDKKLDGVYEDWREMDGAETEKEVFTEAPLELGATVADLDAVGVPDGMAEKLEKEEDMLKLIDIRKEVVLQQVGLRAAVRDELRASEADDEKARHRRHNYAGFLKGWLGALADQQVLSGLLDGGA